MVQYLSGTKANLSIKSQLEFQLKITILWYFSGTETDFGIKTEKKNIIYFSIT